MKRVNGFINKAKPIVVAFCLLAIQMIAFMLILLWLRPMLGLVDDRFSKFLASAISMMGLFTSCMNSFISYIFSFRSFQEKGDRKKLQEQVDYLTREVAELKKHNIQETK